MFRRLALECVRRANMGMSVVCTRGARKRIETLDLSQARFCAVIVGRPNVGKSTLFNRLVGRKLAIVHNTPGVTRDRHESVAHLNDLHFRIVDTAGLEEAPEGTLQSRMLWHTDMAIRGADVAMLMLDARADVTAQDRYFAKWLHKHGIPAFVLVNKVDHESVHYDARAVRALGFGEPIEIAAESGHGLADLYDALRPFAIRSVLAASASPATESIRAEPVEPSAPQKSAPASAEVASLSASASGAASAARERGRPRTASGAAAAPILSPVFDIADERAAAPDGAGRAGGNGDAGVDGAAVPEALWRELQRRIGAVLDDTAEELSPAAMQSLDAALVAASPDATDGGATEGGEPAVRVAVVGRPNVGKSTLINRILGEERLLTGPDPGVTRTAIEVPFLFGKRRMMLIDTAGMRAKSVLADELEKLAVLSSVRAVNQTQVVVLTLNLTAQGDARAPDIVAHQDLSIAALAAQHGRAMVVACNKWDLCEDRAATLQYLRQRIDASLHQVKDVPIVPVSAKKGYNVDALLRTVLQVHDRWNMRIPTATLNAWVRRETALHTPPVRVRFVTQIKTRPPTFVMFCGKRAQMTDAYLRHFTAALRTEFGLQGVPVRILLRQAENPYAKKGQS